MSIYGTWFVSTEAQVAGMWHIRRGIQAINPFTKENVTIDSVFVDDSAIAKLRGVEVKFLLESYVCALFGKNISAERITPLETAELLCHAGICRIPDTAVRSLVDRAPTPAVLLSEWKRNLASLGDRPPYADNFDQNLATRLYELAKTATESGASLYGYVL